MIQCRECIKIIVKGCALGILMRVNSGKENTIVDKVAREAIEEGDKLRKKLIGKRILLDLRDRDLKNSFRL